MSRFDKFIKKELPTKNETRSEEQGNRFKRNGRKRRVYKSRTNKKDFLNKMKTNGATVQNFSIMDALKNKQTNNRNKLHNTKKAETINKKDNDKTKFNFLEQNKTSEKDKEMLKNFVLSRCYEDEESGEESDDVDIQPTIMENNKKDNIIMF